MLRRERKTRQTSIHVHMHTLVKVKMRGSWQRLMGRRKTEVFSDVFLHLNNMLRNLYGE